MTWPVHPAAELFPMLDDAELRELADDIMANGLHEPVWLWDDPDRGTVLLDGRNRAAACALAGIGPTTRRYAGDDPVSFVVSENIRRRHLTEGQKADIALRSEPLYREQAKAKESQRKRSTGGPEAAAGKRTNSKPTGADRHQSAPAMSNSDSPKKRAPKSTDKAAKTAGTSGRSVARMKRITEQAPDLVEQVRSGKLSLDRAERIIRDREAEQRRIDEAKREAAAQPQPSRIDIRLGDFRTVLADLADVDAIITDPPYPAEFLPLLADLAAWADKVLKPDGVLAVLIGQTYLPEVYRLLDGHRAYRWTGCYLTSGQGYVSHPRKVQSNWKPLIVYGGGPRFVDVVRSEGTDAAAKSNHKWGQDYGAFHTIVERLTVRGQVVVDPFMGAGTTLLAAHALGRHAIGCDVEEQHVARAKERIGG